MEFLVQTKCQNMVCSQFSHVVYYCQKNRNYVAECIFESTLAVEVVNKRTAVFLKFRNVALNDRILKQ